MEIVMMRFKFSAVFTAGLCCTMLLLAAPGAIATEILEGAEKIGPVLS